MEGEETAVQLTAFFFEHADFDINARLLQSADAAALYLGKLVLAPHNHYDSPHHRVGLRVLPAITSYLQATPHVSLVFCLCSHLMVIHYF